MGPSKAQPKTGKAQKKSGSGRVKAGADKKAKARSKKTDATEGPISDGGGSPASRRALRNQGRRTMRKLLDAAMVAFDRRGYHATRVNDVVEIAKTSHGTFYLYFSNKEDLLRALVLEAANEVQEIDRALSVGPMGTSWKDLRAWVGAYSAMWTRYAPLLRTWTELTSTDPELAKLVADTLRTMTGAVARWIEANDPPGGVDPSNGGVAVIAMLDRFHYLQGFLGQPIDDFALDTLATMIQRSALKSP